MAKPENMMNILGIGTKFKGNIRVSGSLRIDGEYEGEMSVSETLIVGKTGKIKGNIKTKNCIVGGYINGTLKANERVELQVSTRFEGDIICKKLIIEEGVTFDGNCRMSETKQEGKPIHQEKPK